ncbi:MAG: dioxygenase [Actinobacteria bacterium]|nr:MAG: dioxygenase [Actinomycetota bacterium]
MNPSPGYCVLPARRPEESHEVNGDLTLTPEATQDVGEPTPRQTAGPYFKAGSPERSSLVEPEPAARRLNVSGRVLDQAGGPVPGALLDFWHADETGQYDLVDYRYRGHQFAGENGAYLLETIFPGIYLTRTRHIHVRVEPPGGGALITQQYFPGEPRNETDPIFDARLLLSDVTSRDGLTTATFDFVLAG